MGRSSQSIEEWASSAKAVAIAVSWLLLMTGFVLITADSHKGILDRSKPQLADGFEPYWTPITGGLPGSGRHFGVAFGDVNNDGKLDIAVTTSTRIMHVYVGDGLGNFVEESTGLPMAGNANDVLLADFNNDGNLDLAGDGVYLGNGGDGGSMTWTFDSDPGSWFAATAADVNLDGNMDIVAGTGSGVRVWTGDGGVGGNVVWTDSSNGLPVGSTFWGTAIGDINHDGKPDIVSADRSNGVKAWTGNGLTGPAALWTNAYTGLPTSDEYADVDIGDVNHDGNLDIVSTAHYSGNGVRVWLGDGGVGGSVDWTEGSLGLDTTSAWYLGAKLRDVNNDGNLDIFAAHYQGGGLSAWLGDGGAGGSMDWTEVSTGLPTGNYIDVDAGDYNNDGKMDFVVSLNSGVEVWENEQSDFLIDTYVDASVNLPNAFTWADVQFSDVNHDGLLDVGFTSFQGQGNGIRVFFGDGTGIWTESSNGLPIGGDYSGLRFADLDHNGTIDIVATQDGGGGSNGVHVWSGDGEGNWTEMASVTTRSGAGLELADINNDGNLDVVTGYWSGSWGPFVHLGYGDFTWSANVGPTGETINVDDVAVADVNHDGKLDIAASSMDGVGVQLWTGDGSGTSGGWERNDTGLPTSGVYLGLAFADVNHDGNPDITATGFAGGAEGMYVWLGNGGEGGSMLWTDAGTGLPASGRWGGVEFGDTNLDGDPDLIYASSSNTGATGIGYMRGNGGDGGVVWSDPGVSGIPTTGRYWGVAFGDMDNDGILDIAVTGISGVQVYKQGAPPAQPPQVMISWPDGLQNWTGNTPHTIWWNMTDNSPNDNLLVYVNYSYNAGTSTGTITGPMIGNPNPNSYGWTTPLIDASDVMINVTAIDPDGYADWDVDPVSDIDSSPPSMILNVPADSATDVAIDQPIIIQFSESVRRASATSSFSISPDPGGWFWSWSATNYPDDNMTGTHNPFAYNQTYDVTIDQTTFDASSPGNLIESAYAFSFTTESLNVMPSVRIDAPVGGESWTGGSNHAISFAAADYEDIPSNLLVWLNYSLTCAAPWIPVAGPIPGDSSPLGWTVPLVDTASACLEIEVADTDGGSSWNVSQTFEIDSTPPSVLPATPTNGEQNVPTNVVLQADWSEMMNMPITNASFALYDNATWTPVVGMRSWSGTDFLFNPTFDLLTDSWYTGNFTTSAQDDSEPGNTLATMYSWSFRTAQAPDLTPPQITNVTGMPSPVQVFYGINISADIFDDSGVSGAWIEITPPSGPAQAVNFTMRSWGIRFYYVSTWDLLGNFDYTIWAVDVSDNWNFASGQFTVEDALPPTITDLRIVPSAGELDGYVNVSAIVMDDYLLSGVWINITDPNQQTSNYSMVTVTRHFSNESYFVLGTYNFTIWANDSSGNWANESGSFDIVDSIPPTADAGTNQEVTQGEVVHFDGTGSDDNDRIESFEWTFQDGDNPVIMSGEQPAHIFNNSGTVTVTLTVIDASGNPNSSTVTIIVNPRTPPVTPPEDVDDYLWVAVMLIAILAVLLLSLLYILLKRRREERKEETIRPETDQTKTEESDDVET
ncbi:MAG: PKD domain-containing protein [Methanomassiliicoccales archaeon]|nr:MAG: PKD domain-containing protein [Methanomassiliicoccales archaeon]